MKSKTKENRTQNISLLNTCFRKYYLVSIRQNRWTVGRKAGISSLALCRTAVREIVIKALKKSIFKKTFAEKRQYDKYFLAE
jgi:hypothetical protein